MAGIQHTFVNPKADGADTTVTRPSDWNAAHLIDGLKFGAGTSFPGSPATNDLFYRTDLALDFYWDGTRWLTRELLRASTGVGQSISAAFAGIRIDAAAAPGLDVWLVALDLSLGVFGTNNGSNFWTYTLDKRANDDTGTTLITKDTSALTASRWNHVTDALGVSIAIGTYFNFVVQASVKTGTPANLQFVGGFTYRLIGT